MTKKIIILLLSMVPSLGSDLKGAAISSPLIGRGGPEEAHKETAWGRLQKVKPVAEKWGNTDEDCEKQAHRKLVYSDNSKAFANRDLKEVTLSRLPRSLYKPSPLGSPVTSPKASPSIGSDL